jgi:hypothetical protein
MISSVRNFVVHILDADPFTIVLFQILNIKSNYLPGIVNGSEWKNTNRIIRQYQKIESFPPGGTQRASGTRSSKITNKIRLAMHSPIIDQHYTARSNHPQSLAQNRTNQQPRAE